LLARFIRSAGAGAIDEVLDGQGLLIKGGCGVGGGWAAVPWVCVFDPVITTGAQHGFYLGYLFSADMRHVYLTLNQGTTEVERALGANRQALTELRTRATILRERATEHRTRFSADPIDLASPNFLPRGYEAGLNRLIGVTELTLLLRRQPARPPKQRLTYLSAFVSLTIFLMRAVTSGDSCL
jgi:5-methylcytosine-specific restriction protein A